MDCEDKIKRMDGIYERLLKNRTIFVGEEITMETANFVVAQMLLLDAEDPRQDIIMYINSPGGEVYPGFAIFDVMQFVRPDVATICAGLAASFGALLLIAGTRGKRYALPHARIMLHQPMGGARGAATEIEIQAQEILKVKSVINQVIAEKTGQDLGRIEEATDRNFWMGADEALQYGIVDHVVQNRGDIPISK